MRPFDAAFALVMAAIAGGFATRHDWLFAAFSAALAVVNQVDAFDADRDS